MKSSMLVLAVAACASPALACDFCAIYAATEAHSGAGSFAGVAEQFTHFGTTQENGREVANETDQFLDSSITQVSVGYNFNDRFGVQFNAPIIHRTFKRPEGFETDRGSET